MFQELYKKAEELIKKYKFPTTPDEYAGGVFLCYGFTSGLTALMLSIGGHPVFGGIRNASLLLGNLIKYQNIPFISEALPELFFGFSHLANTAESILRVVSRTFVSIFPESIQSGIIHFANVYAHWWTEGLGTFPIDPPEGFIRMFLIALAGLFAAYKYNDLNRLKFALPPALLSFIDFGTLVFPLGMMTLRSDFDPKKAMETAYQDLASFWGRKTEPFRRTVATIAKVINKYFS